LKNSLSNGLRIDLAALSKRYRSSSSWIKGERQLDIAGQSKIQTTYHQTTKIIISMATGDMFTGSLIFASSVELFKKMELKLILTKTNSVMNATRHLRAIHVLSVSKIQMLTAKTAKM
jgi:hypothetical protein